MHLPLMPMASTAIFSSRDSSAIWSGVSLVMLLIYAPEPSRLRGFLLSILG